MFRDRLIQEDSGGKCYCHEENGLNQQAAGGFSFQESGELVSFWPSESPPQKAGGSGGH